MSMSNIVFLVIALGIVFLLLIQTPFLFLTRHKWYRQMLGGHWLHIETHGSGLTVDIWIHKTEAPRHSFVLEEECYCADGPHDNAA